jgi:hypothetical protein
VQPVTATAVVQTAAFHGATQATQIPEVPASLSPEEAEKLWFQDSLVRERKQLFSLDQVWRFLQMEIDKKQLLERKIHEWEDEL